MSEYKKVRRNYSEAENDEMAYYLSYMSSQGWHFVRFEHGLKFEKGDIEQLEYDVVSFDKAKNIDWGPQGLTKEFIDYCEEAGWQFIDSMGHRCVFLKIREDAVEIFTDEERNVCVKKYLKKEIIVYLIGIVYIGAHLIFNLKMQDGPSETYFSNVDILSSLLFMFFFLSCIAGISYNIYQYIKLGRNKELKKLSTKMATSKKPSLPKMQIMIRIFEIVTGIILLIELLSLSYYFALMFIFSIAVFVSIAYFIRGYNYKHRPNRKKIICMMIAMFVVTVAFNGICFKKGFEYLMDNGIPGLFSYEDTGDIDGIEVIEYPEGTPLTFEDFGIDTELNYSSRHEEKSILGTKKDYWLLSNTIDKDKDLDNSELEYIIYDCFNNQMAKEVYQDLYKQTVDRAKECEEEGDTDVEYPTKIKGGFIKYGNHYTLIYKNIVMEIDVNDQTESITTKDRL